MGKGETIRPLRLKMTDRFANRINTNSQLQLVYGMKKWGAKERCLRHCSFAPHFVARNIPVFRLLSVHLYSIIWYSSVIFQRSGLLPVISMHHLPTFVSCNTHTFLRFVKVSKTALPKIRGTKRG